MTSSGAAGDLPCIERPEFRVFDRDGDGVLSVSELRAAASHSARLEELAGVFETNGIAGIRYTGCGDTSGSGPNTTTGRRAISDEDIALIIARAAVSRLDGQG